MTEPVMPEQTKPVISYQQFADLDLRIATVKMAEPIEGADKLLKITLDVGELGERVVAAGIKEWYAPEKLIGMQILYLANLEPKMLRGVLSQGMIVAAGEDFCVMLQPEQPISAGAIIR